MTYSWNRPSKYQRKKGVLYENIIDKIRFQRVMTSQIGVISATMGVRLTCLKIYTNLFLICEIKNLFLTLCIQCMFRK